jgi:hypothetical protein
MPNAERKDVSLQRQVWILTLRLKALREERAALTAERTRLKTVDNKRERPLRVYVQARLDDIKHEIAQLVPKRSESVSQLRAAKLKQPR